MVLPIEAFCEAPSPESVTSSFSSLFLSWLLPVAVILAQEYLVFPLLRVRSIDSKTYPYLRITLDLFGTFGLLGTLLLAFRRYVQRPRALDNQWTDALSLSPLFRFPYRVLANGNSKSSLPIFLVPLVSESHPSRLQL